MPQQHRRGCPSLWPAAHVLVVLVAALGIGALLYPSAVAWASDRAHAHQVSGYLEHVNQASTEEITRELEAAREYNEALPAGPLRNPFALSTDGEPVAAGAGEEVYRATLRVTPAGVMGRLSIPAIDVDLPIYHGTDEKTLTKGIGHLFGSDLPVGGPGTHTVLTGHSGLVSATMLAHLDKVTVGAEFTITVLDQVLTYRVDQVLVVEPDETGDLARAPGKDYVTLITCTPTAVNTHRLMVRGVRVPTHTTVADSGDRALGAPGGPGYPWWAAGMIIAPTAVIAFTHQRKRVTPLSMGACALTRGCVDPQFAVHRSLLMVPNRPNRPRGSRR